MWIIWSIILLLILLWFRIVLEYVLRNFLFITSVNVIFLVFFGLFIFMITVKSDIIVFFIFGVCSSIIRNFWFFTRREIFIVLVLSKSFFRILIFGILSRCYTSFMVFTFFVIIVFRIGSCRVIFVFFAY